MSMAHTGHGRRVETPANQKSDRRFGRHVPPVILVPLNVRTSRFDAHSAASKPQATPCMGKESPPRSNRSSIAPSEGAVGSYVDELARSIIFGRCAVGPKVPSQTHDARPPVLE